MRTGLWLGLLMLLGANVAAQSARPIRSGDSSTTGPWKQLAKLTEAKGKEQDWLGWSVAISKDGNTVAVGAVGWCPQQGFNGCGQGAVFVFVKPASGWADMAQTALLTASDGQPGEYLGESVAISDDGATIVTGAPLWPADHTFRGASYVFVRPAGGWISMTETARLTSTDGNNVSLGQSVGISGTTIVAGGFGFNTSQGAAYVFAQPKSGWGNMTQIARLTPSDGTDADMGWSVAISGDTVVAGAPFTGTGNAGNGAYVFVKPKIGWKNKTETAKLTASRGTGFYLGDSVSISGSTIAVGAPRRSNANGAIYVYVKPASGWRGMTETARLTGPPKFNSLGYSESIDSDGKRVIGGAPGWQDGIGQGAVDLFVRPTSGWKTTSKSNTMLTARDGIAKDNLGYSVSASPTAISAGAPFAPIGSNAQQGAAYVFGR